MSQCSQQSIGSDSADDPNIYVMHSQVAPQALIPAGQSCGAQLPTQRYLGTFEMV